VRKRFVFRLLFLGVAFAIFPILGMRPLTPRESDVEDDRERIQVDDRVVLIVESDANLARALLDIMREGGAKGVVALGGTTALALARQFKPTAITLDLLLPDLDGWTVLDLLKRDPNTQHIPVHIITVVEDEGERGIQQGAASYLVKPVGKKALQKILDTLETWPGADERTSEPEVLTLSEVPPVQSDPLLMGKKVLIVDDDIRNLFALTSALESYNMKVLSAESGNRGIEILQHTPGIDVVLMDIMMPGLDGYQTIRAIRQFEAFTKLPIIAVTAKAMKGDREKCLEAGASDYIPKPVEIEHLLSRLRRAVSVS